MAPRIFKHSEAERDLDDLFDLIASDSGEARAEAILRRLERSLASLAVNPGIGRIRRDLDGNPRSFAVWPWIIVYEPLDGRKGIAVWRIVDGRRDLPRTILRPRNS